MICSANRLLPLNAWFQYDNKFCNIAASNAHLRWDQQHPDLLLEALILGNLDKLSSKRWPCPYCKATTPFPENCPRSPFCDNVEPNRATYHRTSSTLICGDLNNGNCTRRVCSFKHICLSCKGNHPRISCSSRRPPLSSLRLLVLKRDQPWCTTIAQLRADIVITTKLSSS